MRFLQKKDKKKKSVLSIQEERERLLTPESDFFIREAYKTLRTNVSFALPGEEGCKVVVVTSSLQGEGKSITAVNLAITYAMADQRVLIIDCDMRRPKLARLLQMGAKVGLSNLIVDSKLMSEAIKPTGIANLDVILSGSVPPNPSELLCSVRMDKLIEQLKEKYDYIFLDSPPVNMVTDAVVLAPRTDGVIFLVRADRSERGSVLHAVDQLEYAKAKILGFVLNGVDMQRTHYGYNKNSYRKYFRYGKYSYTYGQGHRYGYSSSMPTYSEAEMNRERDI